MDKTLIKIPSLLVLSSFKQDHNNLSYSTSKYVFYENQTAQELREKNMGYFEGAVTSKTPKDILGFDNSQAWFFIHCDYS